MKAQHQKSMPGNDFGGNLRVLVAEQETAVRDALAQRVLDSLGVHAETCNTARGVEKLLQQYDGEFVLAVVDTRLPDAPEGEVLDLLSTAHVPTIAISPQVTDAVAERLMDRYVIDCILKRNEEDIGLIADLVERTLLNHKRKILLYCTNDFNHRIIRQLLDIHRYTVIDVRSENEVRRQLDSHRDISLVLVDHLAIADDELNLISSLRQHYRKEDLSIAAVCDNRDSRVNARLLRAGVNDVICKPYQADEFYYRIRHCVESVESIREIKFSAIHDRLTGLYNRDYLFEVGEKNYASAQRGDIELSMAMIEIDNFDTITADYGHDASCAILRELAPIIQDEFRRNDLVARYHTATFACMASNVGDHNAIMVFERIRALIAKTPISYGTYTFNLTASIGVSTFLDESFIAMIGNAQAAIEKARESGSNKVVVEN